ncbi:MAG: ribosome silencing factor [Magnetococcus sp. YQC-3]
MTEPEDDTLALSLKAHLEEKKAVDCVVLDLRGRATFADFFVIASGTSHTHVAALAEETDRFFHERAIRVLSVAGLPEATWALVDGGDIVVHLFQQEARAFYDLEKLWSVPTPRPDRSAPPPSSPAPRKPEKPEKPGKLAKPDKPEKAKRSAKPAKAGKTKRP